MDSTRLRSTQIVQQLRQALEKDPWWLERVQTAPRIHLAILVEPFLSYILQGKKTIESRFSVTRAIPFGSAGPGDVVLLKRSSGPVVGLMTVDRAQFIVLGEQTWPRVRALSSSICADEGFWGARADKRYATMLHVGAVRSIEPLRIEKSDRRPWVVLSGTKQLEFRAP